MSVITITSCFNGWMLERPYDGRRFVYRTDEYDAMVAMIAYLCGHTPIEPEVQDEQNNEADGGLRA